MADSRTYYEVLGVSRTADDAEIRRAWKTLVAEWHPDRFAEDAKEEAERTASRINEAYSSLRDTTKRSVYDRRLDADAAAARVEREAGSSSFTTGPFGTTASTRARYRAAVEGGEPGATGPVEPRPLTEVMADMARELWLAARRYPRVTVTVSAVWLVVFGGALLSNLVAGPSLPAGAMASAGAPTAKITAAQTAQTDRALEELERDLAEAAEADQGDEVRGGGRGPAGDALRDPAPVEEPATQPAPGAGPRGAPEPAPLSEEDVVPGPLPPEAYAPVEPVPPPGRRILRVHPQGAR